MSKINEQFVVLRSFMVHELNLKGNELIIYAIIFGFSQDGESTFSGSADYLASFSGCKKRAVYDILSSLVDRGYIVKQEQRERTKGMDRAVYAANLALIQNPPVSKAKQKELALQYMKIYNETCTLMPQCLNMTAHRQSKVLELSKVLNAEKFKIACQAFSVNSYWNGGSDNGTVGDFNAIINQNVAVSMYEHGISNLSEIQIDREQLEAFYQYRNDTKDSAENAPS